MHEAQEPQDNPAIAQGDEGIPTSDPYPRMILVCMGIFVALIIVLFGFIIVDFIQRSEQDVKTMVRPPSHPTATAPPVAPAP